ncbi:MAG: aminotransferase class I/II-fold pyridoxal phosphate-dependent enzyme [Tissierellia bacterium]|nr:aminotransferase class I/II-fold pyridoxal phosphate-dependent enzyme [Tissierellia bacterium]
MKNYYIAKKYWKTAESELSKSAGATGVAKDLINFTLGDPDIHTDKRIVERTFEDVLNGATHYTDTLGILELRQELKNYYSDEYKMEVDLDQLMITTSACQGMWLVMEAILDDGDEVIIPSPHFPPYPDQVEMAGGKSVFLELLESEDFQINIKRLEESITERTKAIIINTPNNPIGSCLSKKTLEDISIIAKKYDLLIIADDIYTLYSYEAPFIPISSIEGMRERTITLGSFSKNFAMAGWRIGYILADPKFIQVFKMINENNVYTAPEPSQRAALHALRLRKEIQAMLFEEFKKRSYYAYERLNKLKGIRVMEPKGTFYLFPNIEGTGLSSIEFADKLLKEAGVAVVPGLAFGCNGDKYIRLAVTLNIEKMKEAFDRIEKMQMFQ